jgi:hypothetical protein
MTRIFTFVFIAFISASAFGQTNAFETLRDKFRGDENVFAISTSGFLARTVLLFAGEHEYKKAIKHVDKIGLITVPKSAFKAREVSLAGFRKFINNDYSLLTTVRDHGDNVELYIRQSAGKKKHNHYLLLVDSDSEVVAIEINGYINPEIMLKESQLSYNQ